MTLRLCNTATLFFVATLTTSMAVSASEKNSADTSEENQSSTNMDLRLRYENVDKDNTKKTANALTMRTLLFHNTKQVMGFSGHIVVEDNRSLFGLDHYSVPQTNHNNGTYQTIADPEHTEINSAYIQYQTAATTVTLGRQEMVLDNARFLGNVAWRNDRQSFDGLSAQHKWNNNLTLNYHHINQRNRIFAQAKDVHANDNLFNLSYTHKHLTATAYSYLLEDKSNENQLVSNDTYGASFSYTSHFNGFKLNNRIELATQQQGQFGTGYIALNNSLVLGNTTVSVNYESLGSDGGNAAFATPLATLHKFNGWTDQFLTTPSYGLEDLTFAISSQLGAGTWQLQYHDFSPTHDASNEKLGNELDIQYVYQLSQGYTTRFKWAKYTGGTDYPETTKLWLSIDIKF